MIHFLKTCLLVIIISGLSSCDSDKIVSKAFQIELESINGDILTLEDYTMEEILVIIFYSPECPMCEKYTLTLNSMMEDYADKPIKFAAVFPGPFSTREEILFFKHKYNFLPDLLLDKTNALAKALSASVTPEVFVITRGKSLAYKGAVDNWMPELGRIRTTITEHYLKDALNAVLSGKKPEVRKTNAVGCLIEFL